MIEDTTEPEVARGRSSSGRVAPVPAAVFEQIVEIAADAIVTVNEAQAIVQFNRGAEQMFGYARADVLGRPLDLLLPERFRAGHPGYVAAFGRSAETARLMGHRREVFGRRRNGEEFPAEASIAKVELGDRSRLYTALVRDVTERKQLERQQKFLADASRTLGSSLDYDSTLDAIVRLAVPDMADACVLYVAEDGRPPRQIGWARDGAVQDALQRRLRGPLAVAAAAMRAGAVELLMNDTGSGSSHEGGGTGADQPLLREIRATSLLAAPIGIRSHTLGALTLIRTGATPQFGLADVTLVADIASRAALALENARLYRDAQRAARARDEVLGVVSHDLRNPLSAIAMCSRILLDRPPDDEHARRELASAISESAGWMSRLIQDLLDVSAIDAGRLSVMFAAQAVAPILEQVIHLLAGVAAERDVELRLDVAPDLPVVWADAERLVQGVANVAGNAVKFTGRGGTVILSARTGAGADTIVISVEDTGPGIAEHDLPHIFDRYWHAPRGTRRSGTGLGLAIARGIVEAHHGRIDVTSTVGVGSRFSIVLPGNPPPSAG